ncbi:hypothetical protein PI124_g16222 [Phytophthora idaei]|nr:hypothetical protein PI124_g16222 [Phytophthora idaei]
MPALSQGNNEASDDILDATALPATAPAEDQSSATTGTPPVVDTTAGVSWTTTSARATTTTPQLRTSKCATKQKPSPAEPAEPRKGKKRLVRKPAGTNEKLSNATAPSLGAGISGASVRLSTPGPDRHGSSVTTAPPAEPSGGSTEPELVATATSAAESVPDTGQTLLSGANTGGQLQGQLVETPSLSFGAARTQRAVPRGDGFNLNDFMSSFRPGSASLQSPRHEEAYEAPDRTAIPSEFMSELRLQRDEVHRLRGQVANPETMLDWVTAPNDLGVLQPAAICQLTYSSFPVESKKTKGDYDPPQAHALAASRMVKQLTPMNGKIPSPISFYQGLREAEGMAFSTTLAVLMAVFSGRRGASGPTILRFKTESEAAVLEAGSSNGNFASDADPYHSAVRVKLTPLFVNKWLGSALGHPQLDDPSWWVRFCRATDTVNFHAKDWSRGLVNALNQDHRLRRGHDHDQRSRAYGAQWEIVGTRSRQRDVLDDIRALILGNRNGEQPCISNLGGGECSGGGRDRCGHLSRVHNWREHVPRRIREWVDHAYRRERQRLEREHRDRALLDNGQDRRDDHRNGSGIVGGRT